MGTVEKKDVKYIKHGSSENSDLLMALYGQTVSVLLMTFSCHKVINMLNFLPWTVYVSAWA